MLSLEHFNKSADSESAMIEVHADVDFYRNQNDLKWKLSFKVNDPQRKIIWNREPLQSSEKKLNQLRSDLLWQKTCFEMFFKATDKDDYFEININEQGEWNIYQFESYRNPQKPYPESNGQLVSFFYDESQQVFACAMHITDFFTFRSPHEISANLCSVLKLKPDNNSTYWALKHASEKPDFHNQNSFILKRKIHDVS